MPDFEKLLAANGCVRAMQEAVVKSAEANPDKGVRSATLLWSGTPKLFGGTGFVRAGTLGKGSWIYVLRLR